MTKGARVRGRRPGDGIVLGRAELALAYELRQAGMKNILVAQALGCNASHLYTLLTRCKREGLSWNPKP